MATTPAVHITRDRFHLAWDPAIPAIETVGSGDLVEFDLLDASGGQLTATSTVEDLGRLDFSRVDQVNGPIAVAGAQPGDTLQIDLLEFEPADWGWTASIPGFGLLTEQFPHAHLHHWHYESSLAPAMYPARTTTSARLSASPGSTVARTRGGSSSSGR